MSTPSYPCTHAEDGWFTRCVGIQLTETRMAVTLFSPEALCSMHFDQLMRIVEGNSRLHSSLLPAKWLKGDRQAHCPFFRCYGGVLLRGPRGALKQPGTVRLYSGSFRFTHVARHSPGSKRTTPLPARKPTHVALCPPGVLCEDHIGPASSPIALHRLMTLAIPFVL